MNVKIDVSNVVLETKNLYLRSFRADDLLDFYEYAKVPGVGEMAGWPHHQNIEITKVILQDFMETKNQFALVYKANNKVIGSLGIEEYAPSIYTEFSNKRGREIGYVLSYDYWGKGLMTEAVQAVIEYLFNELSLDFIAVSHFVDNSRSENLIKRKNFLYYKTAPYKKTAKDCKYYYLLNEKRKAILEVCCGSYLDAINAYEGGATRIELNSALFLGGLTPNSAIVKALKEKTNLEIVAMVRPRASGFCYLKEELEEMFMVAKELLEAGADALAFGFLLESGEVDETNTKRMVELIHSYNRKAVFHRAIDVTIDYFKAFAVLVELGVDRVLTSGAEEKAEVGLEYLKQAYSNYGDKIEIVAGSGVNAKNAQNIMLKTGIYQIHSSCKNYKYDLTSSRNNVSYNYYADSRFEVVDSEIVKNILSVIK